MVAHRSAITLEQRLQPDYAPEGSEQQEQQVTINFSSFVGPTTLFISFKIFVSFFVSVILYFL